MFLLTPCQDGLHDDVGSIFIDGNGLLATVNATNTDQTLASIAQLAIAAAQAFELVSSGGLAAPSLPLARAFEDEVRFRPTDFTNITALVPVLLNKAKTDRIHLKLSDEQYAKMNTAWQAFQAKAPPTDPDVLGVQTALSTVFDEIISSRGVDYQALVTSPAKTRPELGIVHYLSQEWPTLPELALLEQRMLLEDAFKDLAGQQVVESIDWARLVQKVMLAARQVQPPPQKVDVVFDPFDTNQVTKARELLRPAHIDIVNAEEFSKAVPVYPNLMEVGSEKASGIFYRVPMPYDIVLGDNYSNVVSTPLLLPNKSPVLNVEMNKGLFVSSSSQVVLTNGCLYSYSFNKPSALMAAATLPITIISGVSSSLTNLLQLRINLATGQNTLQNTTYTRQTADNNARLAQQTTDIASLSNAITMFNASRALNALTNNASQRP
jgi:hypothetical protein